MVPVLALGGALGAVIGSFLNVVVYRVPLGRSVVAPPSSCPVCAARIRPYDNLPVLSWLLLRGRCRDCGTAISARYPLVEAASAVLMGLVALWGLTILRAASGPLAQAGVLAETVAFLYLMAVSVALALIDIDVQRLPNAIVLPAYGIGGALLTAAALLQGAPERLIPAVAGGALQACCYALVRFAKPGGMGLGDVKLAGVLGLYLGFLGWPQLAVGGFAAFLAGGLFGVALLVGRRARASTAVPFGPWMLLGAWLGVFSGGPVWHAYLALFGLV